MRRIVMAAVFTMGIWLAAEASAGAWWVTARFTPTETSIEGIPVEEIDPRWTKALLLKKEVLPADGQAYLDRFLPPGTDPFERVGDFNADGALDKAVVGVFADDGGQFGRFFLILTQTRAGAWKKVFLHRWDPMPDVPGFSRLMAGKFDGSWQLFWGVCFECDEEFSWLISWNGKEYVAGPVRRNGGMGM